MCTCVCKCTQLRRPGHEWHVITHASTHRNAILSFGVLLLHTLLSTPGLAAVQLSQAWLLLRARLHVQKLRSHNGPPVLKFDSFPILNIIWIFLQRVTFGHFLTSGMMYNFRKTEWEYFEKSSKKLIMSPKTTCFSIPGIIRIFLSNAKQSLWSSFEWLLSGTISEKSNEKILGKFQRSQFRNPKWPLPCYR